MKNYKKSILIYFAKNFNFQKLNYYFDGDVIALNKNDIN